MQAKGRLLGADETGCPPPPGNRLAVGTPGPQEALGSAPAGAGRRALSLGVARTPSGLLDPLSLPVTDRPEPVWGLKGPPTAWSGSRGCFPGKVHTRMLTHKDNTHTVCAFALTHTLMGPGSSSMDPWLKPLDGLFSSCGHLLLLGQEINLVGCYQHSSH